MKIETKSQVPKKGQSILDYLEESARSFPDRIAVDDGKEALTYRELLKRSRQIGSILSQYAPPNSPVPFLMEKSAGTLAVLFGIVYAGCFYVPIHPSQPARRIQKILETLQAGLLITLPEHKALAADSGFTGRLLLPSDFTDRPTETDRLAERRKGLRGSCPLYGIFTSGSTGTPKGIVVSHQAVMDFIGHFIGLFGITEKDRIGNQAPFDFDVSVKDIYSAAFTGATLVLIPRELFSIPPRLMDYLCKKRITTMTWAVSALCMISALKGLDYRGLPDVKRILFSGEVMPSKQLALWQKALPEALLVNLYGPSEITCNCTYHIIRKPFDESQKLPIGIPFPGRTVLLLDEEGREITVPHQKGEICVMGESLSEGYYRNPLENQKHFLPYFYKGRLERLYRTGDLGYRDEEGLLYFAGRRDFQIKHMGHRIELEEIERMLNTVEGVQKSCCIFFSAKQQIQAFYVGCAKPESLRRAVKKKLPPYMLPGKIFKLSAFPLTKNGKVDRAALLEGGH